MNRTVPGRVVIFALAAASALCVLAYVAMPLTRMRGVVNQAFQHVPGGPIAPALPPLPEFPLHSMEPEVREQFGVALEHLRTPPGSAADNAMLGTLYLAYRMPALAEPCLARAAALEPPSWRYRYLLGVARFDQGHFAPAVESFEAVLARRPAEVPVLLYRAESLRRLGRLDESLAGFVAVMARDAKSARASFGAGQVELRLGHADRAEAHFREALRLQPRYGAARYALGQALRRLGRLDEAQAQLARAERQVAEPPVDEELDQQLAALRTGAIESLHRGIELAQAGEFDSAIPLFERALRIDPELAEAHGQLGAALLVQGNEPRAREELQRALELDPGFADGHYNLGLLAHRQERLADAVASFEEAVALRPDYFEAHLALGADLRTLGRLDEARAHLRQAAAALHPADARHCKQLAGLLAALGEAEAAESALRACARRLPEDASVIDRLAWLLATTPDELVRDPAEALALADEACRRTGNDEPLALATRAAALAALRRFDEAAEAAARARTLAQQKGKADWVAQIGAQLEAYQAGQPWIDGT